METRAHCEAVGNLAIDAMGYFRFSGTFPPAEPKVFKIQAEK